MKYSGLRNQIAALRAQLPLAGLRIEIRGGLPPDAAAKPPDPPGIELKSQAAAFRRPTGAPNVPSREKKRPPRQKRRPRASLAVFEQAVNARRPVGG